jgi:23S rRNA pseudouridine1911/1915/1917 synthase
VDELYSDAYLLAVNKPGGMPVQPDPTGDMSLFQLVQTGPPERPDAGMPHRVDRPVSGVVLFTLTADALAAMSALFAEQRVHKVYWAVVEGTPGEKGSWMHRLTHDAHAHKARVVEVPEGHPCITHYRRLAQGDRYALLELIPEGGRFHQLRAQCAAAGHSIKGDVKYGARRGEADRTIGLHARSITFEHPFTGKQVVVEAPPPSSPLWKALLEKAG